MIDPAADLLPEGLEDRLPPAAAAAARIEHAILGLLDAHGYDRVRPPLIEFEGPMARRMDGGRTERIERSEKARVRGAMEDGRRLPCARWPCART